MGMGESLKRSKRTGHPEAKIERLVQNRCPEMRHSQRNSVTRLVSTAIYKAFHRSELWHPYCYKFGMLSGADIFMRDNHSFTVTVSKEIAKQNDGGGFDHA
jgi:hypothetical protein